MHKNQKWAASIVWLAGIALLSGCCCCRAPEPPSNGVQIKVNVSNLSDAEVEDLKDKLAAIAGNDASMSTVINGAATWNYTTDLEPQAFADQIDFATVTGVSDRVITLNGSDAAAGDGTADGAETDGAETDGAATDAAETPADGSADADSAADSDAPVDGEAASDDGAADAGS